jgi:N-methylhydantoinase A/oxoprolinase/acetone carboxylase beta subunit
MERSVQKANFQDEGSGTGDGKNQPIAMYLRRRVGLLRRINTTILDCVLEVKIDEFVTAAL